MNTDHALTSISGAEALQLQCENANLKMIIDEIVNQRVEQKLAAAGKVTAMNESGVNNTDNLDSAVTVAPLAKHNKAGKARSNTMNNNDIIKSPSDTTIYAPASTQGKRVVNALDQISNFVEGIHISSGSVQQQQMQNNVMSLHDHCDEPERDPDKQNNTQFIDVVSAIEEQTRIPRRSLEADLNRVDRGTKKADKGKS